MGYENRRIPTVLGSTEIMCRFESLLTPYNEILICPKCLRSVHLGKQRKRDEWSFEKSDTLPYTELECNSEEDFYNHRKKCRAVLKGGINKIDCYSGEQARVIACQMAKWSIVEADRDDEQITERDIKDREVIAYVYVDEIGPVSYVAFRPQYVRVGDEICSFVMIWDLYTFPSYRGKGIETTLLEYGIKDLKIDPSLLPVAWPLTKFSASIIKKICTEKIIAVTPEYWYMMEKKDIRDR